MDMNQMKAFITAAKCLNFTEAAAQLFISQPTLSRQISSIEKELNMQLFIRKQKSVCLTPAGSFLYEKFSSLYAEYTDIIHQAQIEAAGYSGVFHIGILDGHDVNTLFPDLIKKCFQKYPDVRLFLKRGSFRMLTDGLYDGSLDLIFTLFFDIHRKEQIYFKKVKSTVDAIVLPETHLLAKQKSVSLCELKDEPLILISPEDSSEAASQYLTVCKKLGYYPSFRYAPNLETEMLWVEAGMGIALINTDNMLAYHPRLKTVPVRELKNSPETDLVASWHSANQNPFLKNFLAELENIVKI